MLAAATLAATQPAAADETHLAAAIPAMTMARVPVQHCARLRECGGFQGRPVRSGTAQVQALRPGVQHGRRRGRGALREPSLPVTDAQEDRRTGSATKIVAMDHVDATLGAGQRAAVVVEQQHPRLRPQGRQRLGLVAERIGAIQRPVDEGEGRHTVKLLPQPQVLGAFGRRFTYWAAFRVSV